MNKFRVLVVDDEAGILRFLKIKLRNSGYEVLTATNGFEALEILREQEPNLLVLDVMMPGIDGFETLDQIRKTSPVPVIILSAKNANNYKIKGFTLGADDYLAKPFSPDELVARIEAIRRRVAPAPDYETIESLSFQNVTISVEKHLVIVNDKEIPLTRIEWLLLTELARNAGKLMFYGDLLSKIWGPAYHDDVQILRTWVSRLRKKLEKDPRQPALIRTVPGTGYIMNQPSP